MKGQLHFSTALPRYSLFSVMAWTLALAGCASPSGKEHVVANKADPYESVNRRIYNFNDKVDNYIAEPISDVYRTVTPEFLQTGVFNFFNNLDNINVVLNDLLQGKFHQSLEDTGRFAMNSTLGLLGTFDVAKTVGLPQNNEDFEQTLAVWGVPRGPYLVVPFIGPSTPRGIPGAVFDTAANPSSYVGAPVQLLSLLNKRANAEGALKFIDEAALDPYVFTRESFLQWRTSLANDGKATEPEEFADDLGESDGESPKKKSPSHAELASVAEKLSEASKTFERVAKSFEKTANLYKASGIN